jgi:hypothetical protein
LSQYIQKVKNHINIIEKVKNHSIDEEHLINDEESNKWNKDKQKYILKNKIISKSNNQNKNEIISAPDSSKKKQWNNCTDIDSRT